MNENLSIDRRYEAFRKETNFFTSKCQEIVDNLPKWRNESARLTKVDFDDKSIGIVYHYPFGDYEDIYINVSLNDFLYSTASDITQAIISKREKENEAKELAIQQLHERNERALLVRLQEKYKSK